MKMKIPSKIWSINTSLAVPLPASLVKMIRVKGGDEVSIEVQDDERTLIVRL
jgi:antitoxin component of MazEF toxin-antitoxin module